MKNFDVAYMPYVPISQSLDIGEYEIWPFENESETRVPNRNIRRQISQYLKRYCDYRFNERLKRYVDAPRTGILLVTPKGFNLGRDCFTEQQLKDLRCVSNIISFCAITSWGVTASSDACVLLVKRFRAGEDGVALYNKYFDTVRAVKFLTPYHIDEGLIKFDKNSLADALGKALSRKNIVSIQRVFRCVELFHHAATHADMVTDEQMLLSLLMSFQCLLAFENKMKFLQIIDKRIAKTGSTLETRTIAINHKLAEYHATQTGWWCYDLYNLRNNIIHGNSVDWEYSKYGGIWDRLAFGGKLLKRLVKLQLAEENAFTFDFSERIIESLNLDDELGKLRKRLARKSGGRAGLLTGA